MGARALLAGKHIDHRWSRTRSTGEAETIAIADVMDDVERPDRFASRWYCSRGVKRWKWPDR